MEGAAGKKRTVKRLKCNTLTTRRIHTRSQGPIPEDSTTSEGNCNMSDIGEKVLKNPVILRNCFDFLSLEDIKQCRLVCTQWYHVSNPFVRKMSAIPLGYPEKGLGSSSEERSVSSFKSFFGNSALGTNFSAFKLQTSLHHEAIWPAANLIEFFEDQRKNMKELCIKNVEVQHLGVYQHFFDLNFYIENHLSHLVINNELGTKFKVSTEKLAFVKNLSLQHCCIDFVNGCLLNVTKLELNHVTISKDGEMTENFQVNEIIDFKTLKELTLVGKSSSETDTTDSDDDSSAVSLDLSSRVTLNHLSLSSVKLLNFEKAAWRITGKFELNDVPFTEKSLMDFTELDFKNSLLYLPAIPANVEKLTLDAHGLGTAIICPDVLDLPNLKYLHFITDCTFEFELDDNDVDHNDVHCLYFISLFTFCKNLKTVKLSCDNNDKTENTYNQELEDADQLLNTEWLPKSIQNLSLSGNIVVSGHKFTLQKLVIQDNRLSDLRSIVCLLKAKILVIDFNSEYTKGFNELEATILLIVRMAFKKLFLGSIKVSHSVFKKSLFSRYVDKRAQYYLFENRKGKAIQESEFKRILQE